MNKPAVLKPGRNEEVRARFSGRPTLFAASYADDVYDDYDPADDNVGGLMVIPICGPLSNAAWSWGGTTYGAIQRAVRAATDDPRITGVVLAINSPGGETDNAFETAAMIADLAKKKPVHAVAMTCAYSSAYLLASQATKIWSSPVSGGVGCIGVFMLHVDASGAMELAGLKPTIISAGDGKALGNQFGPLSPEDLAVLQAEVDRQYSEFVEMVSTGRGKTPKAVIALGARPLWGSDAAIASGLADYAGGIADAVASLRSGAGRSSDPAVNASQGKGTRMDNSPADAAINENALATARAEGAVRAALIVDLCTIAGKSNLAAGFLAANKSPEEVRATLISARAEEQGKELTTEALPGRSPAEGKTEGKAESWVNVWKALGFKTKGGAN